MGGKGDIIVTLAKERDAIKHGYQIPEKE